MQEERRGVHLYAGKDYSVLRRRRLARLSRLGVSGVWLRVDRAEGTGPLERALGAAGLFAGKRMFRGGGPGSVPSVVLYTEDPALLANILRLRATGSTAAPGIALPFELADGLAGELAGRAGEAGGEAGGHAGMLAPETAVYLTAFPGTDTPGSAARGGKAGGGRAAGSAAPGGGGVDAGGGDVQEEFVLGLARSARLARR
ncbi:MAG: hypothetical protein ACOC8N_08820, partial [Spirochaetota bacterium]